MDPLRCSVSKQQDAECQAHTQPLPGKLRGLSSEWYAHSWGIVTCIVHGLTLDNSHATLTHEGRSQPRLLHHLSPAGCMETLAHCRARRTPISSLYARHRLADSTSQTSERNPTRSHLRAAVPTPPLVLIRAALRDSGVHPTFQNPESSVSHPPKPSGQFSVRRCQ